MRRLSFLTAALASASVAVAVAAAPVAVTGPATDITSTTATLTGTVSPNGEDTTYFFEYGPTASYGSKTAVQGPVKGNGDRNVTAAVTGLSPSTLYHYRLVAVNPSGTVAGADATFTTTAPGATGPELSIAVSRKTVVFGGAPVTISGTLTGPGNAGVTVTLEENPAPYTGNFKSTGLTTTTDAAGRYTISVSPPVNTRYRVVTSDKKPTTSGEVQVRVRPRVTLRVSDRTPTAGERVRFSGTVLPGHDGKIARIQRRTASGAWRTVARTTLVAASPVGTTPRSKYAKRVRVRKTGVYRVRVAPADGDHIAGISRKRKLTVG